MHQFTKLRAEVDDIAPDNSEVRLLLRSASASMANFQLAAGRASAAVQHLTVEELWFVVSGTGEIWLSTGGTDDVVALEPGVSVAIPVGTRFQFRAGPDAALSIVGVTIPPWPTDRLEAVQAPTQRWVPAT